MQATAGKPRSSALPAILVRALPRFGVGQLGCCEPLLLHGQLARHVPRCAAGRRSRMALAEAAAAVACTVVAAQQLLTHRVAPAAFTRCCPPTLLPRAPPLPGDQAPAEIRRGAAVPRARLRRRAAVALPHKIPHLPQASQPINRSISQSVTLDRPRGASRGPMGPSARRRLPAHALSAAEPRASASAGAPAPRQPATAYGARVEPACPLCRPHTAASCLLPCRHYKVPSIHMEGLAWRFCQQCAKVGREQVAGRAQGCAAAAAASPALRQCRACLACLPCLLRPTRRPLPPSPASHHQCSSTRSKRSWVIAAPAPNPLAATTRVGGAAGRSARARLAAAARTAAPAAARAATVQAAPAAAQAATAQAARPAPARLAPARLPARVHRHAAAVAMLA